MNTFHVKLVVFLWCFLVYPAYAINKSTVINKTDKPIAVVWTALGCLHYRFDHRVVCAGLILDPGEKHKYQYNWGATNDHIHAGGFVKKSGKYLVPGSEPSSYSRRMKGNCKLPSPDGKVVYITSMSIDEKKGIINCKYEIHSSEDIDLFSVPEVDNGADESYRPERGCGSRG